MLSVKDFIKDNKYPQWIRKNPIFSKIEYIRKVFSTIGLSNFEEKYKIDNSKEIIVFANQLLNLIAECLFIRKNKLTIFSKKAKIGKVRREHLSLLLSIMDNLIDLLKNNQKDFITVKESGKISLVIPQDLIYNGTVFMKSGTGLFKVYEKINSILKENCFLPLQELNQKSQYKNYSSINIPTKEAIIKFSSEGEDGVWDIATMSMRGVNSCQTWTHEHGAGNTLKIIGSIIDPFTGIIYITNGSIHNEYGTRMIRRCVVRYVIDSKLSKPFILLEKMYPAFDKPSLDAFVDVLKKRIENISIKYSQYLNDEISLTKNQLENTYVPLSDEIKSLDEVYYPYRDSGIKFLEDKSCNLTKKPFPYTQYKIKISKLFQQSILSQKFSKEKIKQYGNIASKEFLSLRERFKDKDLKKNKTSQPLNDMSLRFYEFLIKDHETSNLSFEKLLKDKKEYLMFFKQEFESKLENKCIEYISNNVSDYINQHCEAKCKLN